MATSKIVVCDFDSCPECGSSPDIFTTSTEDGIFYDEDLVICPACNESGQFSCGDRYGHIIWHGEKAITMGVRK